MGTMPKTFYSERFLKHFWQTRGHFSLAILSIIAILVHLAMLNIEILKPFHSWPLFILIAISAPPIAISILKDALKLDLGADLLALIAMITAIILHQYLAATFIIFMVASGQALEQYAIKRASSVLEALVKRMPTKARRKKGNDIEEINAENIALGDLLIVLPHEVCPVDGVVEEGHGSMDESYLTGEPYHVPKATGSTVFSGAINQETMLTIRTTKIPKDSRYAEIIKVMNVAEAKRPKMRRLADQLGAIFGPVAFLFALGTWIITGDAMRFLSVLVIATPCPLLIAIPITIISAISLAARRGIVIKDPTILERLPTCSTAIFDKTGTLTYGKPLLTHIIVRRSFNEKQILSWVASLERYSRHPLAQAVLDAASYQNIPLVYVKNLSEKPGQGLVGSVNDRVIKITHRKKILEENPELIHELPEEVHGLECQIIVDNNYAATLQFRDAPRPLGQSFIGHLGPFHAMNRVMIVSGDRESEVSYLARHMGIKDTRSSQSPEQKLAIVIEETKRAPTLFVGDGINDAPALKAATVGIAFGANTDVAKDAAGAVVLENDLVKVDELLHLSQKMRKIALQSALFGISFSAIGMGFAAFGYLSPLSGAILQECIDVLAILNSLRLTWQSSVAIDLPKDDKNAG